MSKPGNALEGAIRSVSNVGHKVGETVGSISVPQAVTVGAAGFVGAMSMAHGAPAGASTVVQRPPAQVAYADNVASMPVAPRAVPVSGDTKAPDPGVAKVAKHIEDSAAEYRFMGASPEAAEHVATQTAEHFLGKPLAEIVGTSPDGKCILKTNEGHMLDEFAKTDLSPEDTPEQAKAKMLEALCPADGGTNRAAVASKMAKLEAMKKGMDINKDFEEVYGKMAQKYYDAMNAHPQLAQSYLETVQDFMNDSTFSKPVDISGQTDESIYVRHDNAQFETVGVKNKAGVSGVMVSWTVKMPDGTVVKQDQLLKECIQDAKTNPAPEKNTEHVAPPARAITPPEHHITEQQIQTQLVTHEVHVCTGLNPQGGFVIETVTGTGATEEEAVANAQQHIHELGYDRPGICEVIDTTTTTAPVETTVPPETVPPPTNPPETLPPPPPPTNPPTTVSDKDPTQTTFPVDSTTVPVADPVSTAPPDSRPDATVAGGENASHTTDSSIPEQAARVLADVAHGNGPAAPATGGLAATAVPMLGVKRLRKRAARLRNNVLPG